MKKILLIGVILFVFILGIKLGDNYTISDSNIFESEKNRFEQEITNPNNNYQSSNLIIEEGVTNKVAHKIDEVIEKIIKKLLNSLE